MWHRLLSLIKNKFNRSASTSRIADVFQKKYTSFKTILESNSELLKIISDLEEKLGENRIFPMAYIRSQTSRVIYHAVRMIEGFEQLSRRSHTPLTETLNMIRGVISTEFEQIATPRTANFVLPYNVITKEMVGAAGGKNAILERLPGLEFLSPRGLPSQPRHFKPSSVKMIFLMKSEWKNWRLTLKIRNPLSGQATIFNNCSECHCTPTCRTGYFGSLRTVDRSSKTSTCSTAQQRHREDSDISFAGQYLSVLNVLLRIS